MNEMDTFADIGKYLSDEFGMDEEDIAQMSEFFIETLQASISEMELKLQSADYLGMSQTGHTLKGAALNIGALHLGAVAAAIEEAADSSDIDKCSELTDNLKEAYRYLTSS